MAREDQFGGHLIVGAGSGALNPNFPFRSDLLLLQKLAPHTGVAAVGPYLKQDRICWVELVDDVL